MKSEFTNEHLLLLEFLSLCPDLNESSVELLRHPCETPSDDELLDSDGPTFPNEHPADNEILIKEAAQLLMRIGDKITITPEQTRRLLSIATGSTKEVMVDVLRKTVEQSVVLVVNHAQPCSMQQTQVVATVQLIRRAMVEAQGAVETMGLLFNAAAVYLKELGGWRIVTDNNLDQ